MEIQNPLKARIKQYIQLKFKALTPEVFKQNKVNVSEDTKNALFKYLEQKESKLELQAFIESPKIVSKARPFIKKEFLEYFEEIKKIKKNFINEIFSKSKIAFEGDISDELMSSVYKNSSNEIQVALEKTVGPQQAKKLSNKISNYLSSGIFPEEEEISISKQEKQLVLKYLQIVLSQKYYIEGEELDTVFENILANNQDKLKETISGAVAPEQYQIVQRKIIDLIKICEDKNWQEVSRRIQFENEEKIKQQKLKEQQKNLLTEDQKKYLLTEYLLNKLKLQQKYFIEEEQIKIMVQGILKQDFQSFQSILEAAVDIQQRDYIYKNIKQVMKLTEGNRLKELQDIQIIEDQKKPEQKKQNEQKQILNQKNKQALKENKEDSEVEQIKNQKIIQESRVILSQGYKHQLKQFLSILLQDNNISQDKLDSIFSAISKKNHQNVKEIIREITDRDSNEIINKFLKISDLDKDELDKEIQSLKEIKIQNENERRESLQKYVAKLLADQYNFYESNIKSIVDAILQQNLSKVKSIITTSMRQQTYIKEYRQKFEDLINICKRKQWGQIDNLLIRLERLQQQYQKPQEENKKIYKQIVSQMDNNNQQESNINNYHQNNQQQPILQKQFNMNKQNSNKSQQFQSLDDNSQDFDEKTKNKKSDSTNQEENQFDELLKQINSSLKIKIPIEFSVSKLESIESQPFIIEQNLPAFKPPISTSHPKPNIKISSRVNERQKEEKLEGFKPGNQVFQTQAFDKNSLNKKIYMIVKLREKITIIKSNGLSKISLRSNVGTMITVKLISTMLKYNLIQFTLPKAGKNETYTLRFMNQNQKQYESEIKILGKDFDQQINFLIMDINYKLITKEIYQFSVEIQKSCLVQNILMFCILGKENIFRWLFDWLEQKPNIKSSLIQEINNFQEDDCFKNIKKLCRQKKWRQNIIPYVLANIYTFKKESFKSQKQGYIEKYFLYQVQYNQIQPMPLLKEYENMLRRCILQIYYIYSKQNYKISELFNEILRCSPNENINFLMRIVYDSRTANRKFKLANVDIKKLKIIMLGLKDYIPIIEYIYYFLLCLDIINNNQKVVIFNYIIELIAQLDFQHQQLEVIENTKNQQYHIHACKQLLNFFYKENNFQFNENNDDFIRFYLCCAKLPNKYKNIFVTPSLVQKTKYFIKNRMQIKNEESLELLRVIFIQCQTLELLYSHLFEGFIIDFFYKNIPSKYYRESTNVLIKLDSKILEYFVEQIIAQFYIKKKYSSDDKFRVLNELIKELNLFSFEEIFTILDKGIQRFNTTNKQHIFLINYLFTNIFKNLMVKQSNLYQNLIINKKWLLFFKLNSFSKQYLIQKLITQAKNLDKYNYKDTNSMIDMINDTVLNTYYLTEQQKDQIINLIYNINDQSSIDLPILKNVLYERPHLALTYSRCLDRGKISITTKIKGTVNQLKTELKEKKVTYKNIKKVYQYGQSIWQKLSKLFDCVGEKNLKTIIQQLYKQCQNFIAHLQMISKISKFFEFKVSKLINLSAINTFSAFINMEKNLDFDQNQILQPFKKLKSEVNKYIGIKYFRIIVPEKQPNDSSQFVTLLNFSVNLFVQNINKVCSKYVKSQLMLNELQEITNNQNKKDIKEILKTNLEMSDQHIEELIYVTEKITQLNEFSIIYETLVNFLNYYGQGKINLVQLKNIFNKYNERKYNQIEVNDIHLNIKNFEKLLDGYQLKLNKQDQINKVIKQTKLTKSLEGIWNLLDRISLQEIEDIKDYLNDQQQAFVNAKTISQLEYVHKYFKNIIKGSKTFHEFLKKLKDFLAQNVQKQIQSLSNSIKSTASHHIQLQKIYLSSKHRQNSFKFTVIDLMEKSTIIIKHIEESDEKDLIIKISNNEKVFTKKQLNDWRDKSLLLINAVKKQSVEEEEQNKKQKVDLAVLKQFVNMYEKLEKMIENYKKLSYMGYFNNFVKTAAIQWEKTFELSHKIYTNVQIHNKQVTKQYQSWEKQMDEAYARSFSLCHFQGKQLKKIMKNIVDQKFDPILNKILPNINQQNFKRVLESKDFELDLRDNKNNNNPTKQLKFLSNLFIKLESMNGNQSPLNYSGIGYRQNTKVQVKMVVIEETINYYGLKSGLKDVSEKINMPQILLCRNTTNQYQIKTFLLRTIQDRKRPYFVIGTHNLTAKIQNSFCEFLKKSLEHQKLKHTVKYMNLYMIDNSTNQKIYNFIANNKQFKLTKIENKWLRHECDPYFHKQADNLLIVESSAAGLGKTFYIQNQIKAKNLNPVYFPVAGNLEFNRLYQRIYKLKLDEKSALVIQIHNIKDKKILDQFLFQVIFYKCLKNEGFLFLPQHLHIYVQLQNVLNQKYFQQYQTLKIFKDNNKFVKKINQVVLSEIKINQDDPKLLFVIKYLQILKDKKIHEYQISFQDFKNKYKTNKDLLIDDKRAHQLLNEYLLKPLLDKKNKPSYVQIQSFLSLLFESLKTFASSYYYKVEQLNFYHVNFPNGKFNQYRHQYVTILINNARDFLLRTISQKNFEDNKQIQGVGQSQQFNQILKQFPFLIVSNGDQSGYSFIYKNDQLVDQTIKKYILVQQNKLKQNTINNSKKIKQLFKQKALNSLKLDALKKELLNMLKQIAGLPPNVSIKEDQNYSITLDNFFKMCLIIQRMRAKIPIIIMGETGVGKTALIRYLVQNIYQDQLMLINIHAGINESHLIKKIQQMKKKEKQIKQANQKKSTKKRLWVFFDEFNTSEEVGYIKQIIMQKRFLGEPLSQNFVFLAACNPFRKKQNKEEIKVGIEKKVKNNPNQGMLYKVLPPPQSLIECMWNFQQLKTDQSKQYIYTILSTISYRPNDISEVVHFTHQKFKKQIQKSAVNLRDVSRFKILYQWFMKNMPTKPVHHQQQKHGIDYTYNYKIKRQERAFILSVCFCYYMRLETIQKRNNYLKQIQKLMKYQPNYISKILENEQIDYLSRMEKPQGTALNLALRQNVFTSFVCLMNKLPIIIVGMPGCSKSLAIRLLLSNLRGKNSDQQFFKNLPQIQMFQFQGSESCSSQGVQQVFERAYRLLKDFKQKNSNIIPCILFDQIGLAELSVHNPLKVLHSHLQVNHTKVSFIGISNWQLDASKMARFLVINRPIPDNYDLFDTANKIFQSQDPALVNSLTSQIKALSFTYFKFIQQWKKKINNDFPDFFGLRDFYSLIKYIVFRLKDGINQGQELDIIKRSVERNFDGRPDSIKMFLTLLRQQITNQIINADDQTNILSLIHQNLSDKQSRCLLQIIKGQALIYILNQQQLQLKNKNIITIHGSTFEQDKSSQQYNLVVISDIINYVSLGYIIILKDVPNNIQTSLYDLLNKSFQRVGSKNYARIAVGANYNPKCFVHQDFNCIVYIMESLLKEVDPPFLNRFQKHYLVINKFITHYESRIIQALMSWINELLSPVLNKQNPLLKQHYMVNISDESLASLAIKQTYQIQTDLEKENKLEGMIENCKKILLMNSTTDFSLLIKTDKNIEKGKKQFIQKCLQEKKQFIKKGIHEQERLIIYTYDKNTEIYEQNILYEKEKTKVVKICQMRCQKELRSEIQQFYKQQYTNLHIKLNYEKQHNHLCLIIFLIQTIAKRFNNPKNKRVYLILMLSRLTLLTAGKNHHKQVSYLNGYKQIFIERLEQNSVSCDEIPVQGVLQRFGRIFNFQQSISRLFSDCLKRFDFTYAVDQEKQNLIKFNDILSKMSENQKFLKYCTAFMKGKFTQPDPKNWQKEVLNNRQIALSSHTTYDAMMRYFNIRMEDFLASYIYFIVQHEVVYCFDYETSVQILQKYIPNSKDYLTNIFKQCKQSYEIILDKLLEKLSPKGHVQLKKISKGAGEQRMILTYPKLFPFINKERMYILKKQRNLQEQNKENQVKIEQTLEDMCEKISELEQKLNSEQNQESKPLLESKLKEAKDMIMKKTKLANYDQQGQRQYDYIDDINKLQGWKQLKSLFLFDIKNIFLKNTIQVNIDLSLEFNQLISYFTLPDTDLVQQLMIVLRGSQLWQKFLSVHKVFKQLEKSKKCRILFENYQSRMIQNKLLEFFKHKINFIKQFIGNCEIYLFPSQENIDNYQGFKNYQIIFNNVYYILEGLENQYQQLGITVPEKIRLMKNFIKTLENIDQQDQGELCNKFLVIKQKNLYIRINEFLEDIRKIAKYEDKSEFILKYQAGYLYRYWIEHINSEKINGEEAKNFINKFINLVNKEKYFAHSCSYVIWTLFSEFEFQQAIDKIIKELSSDKIKQNLFFQAIDKSIIQGKYDNHLSVVLIDFICKRIPEPEPEYDIQDPNQFNEYCLKQMYENVKNVLNLDKDNMNGLQNIIFLALMRNYLNYYIECLVAQVQNKNQNNDKQRNQKMLEIDNILSRPQKVFENLRIYCLKLLRKKIGIKQIKSKYININRASWIKKMETEFIQIKTKQFIIPPLPTQENKQMTNIIQQFVKSDYKDRKLLSRLFEFNNQNDRYRLFTFFMTDIYSCFCKSQSKKTIVEFLKQQHPKLEWFQLDLLRRYADSKITQKFTFNQNMEVQVLQNQIYILNNINYLVAIRSVQSPLTSIFFTKQGKMPVSFSQHTNQQFILCGKDNPYRSIMQSTIFSTMTRNIGVYICSNKCDFIYGLEGCGWPSDKSKCRFCDSEIAGGGHQLLRENQGSRRLGPNLLFLNNQFQKSYAAANTYHPPFYVWTSQPSLQTVDYYWKWLQIYIEKEIERIIQKKEVVIQEKKMDQLKKVIVNPITYKLTGFTKYTNETQSRLHSYTNNLLGFTLNSLLYFFIQFGWIKEQQCVKSFEGRNKNQMIEFTFTGINNQANKLKQTLDTAEWKCWLMGMQKQIFETAINYKGQVQSALEARKKNNEDEKKKIQQVKNKLAHPSYKLLFDNVLNEGIIFSIPKIQIYTAHKCWNRDFFEKIIERNIKARCSGQDKVNFIKNFKNQKGQIAYPFDKVLTESQANEIEKYNYLKILRVAQNPSYAHMIKQYSMKINAEYPILDFLLSNRQKLEKIESFYYIVNFVNSISEYVQNRFSRQIAKTTSIQDFINNLKVQVETKKSLEGLLNKFLTSWNKLANKLGVLQYECKVLGTMSQYTLKTPLIAFLIDSLDNSNYFGKILNCVFHLFAAQQNGFINSIQAKKNMIPHLKDVQLFTQNQYLPQKIYEKDIIKISQDKLQGLVSSLSSSSVQYGNGIPMYNFEVLQYKLTTQLYGKKRIVTDMKQYINIQFAGEMFNRMGQYSNYITEVREAGGNKSLPDLNEIREKFNSIKNRNQNNYFNTMKSIQGFLQKIMIFFKTLQPKQMSLKDYIQKYKFKNCPQELIEIPFRNLPVQCIVNLYEQVQLSIINKTWQILPEIYRGQQLTQQQKIDFKKFLNKAKNKRDNDIIPSVQEFKVAFYRLTSRCLVLAEIPNDKLLMEFLPNRADFWPYNFREQIRENIQQNLNCSIELKKTFSLYDLINKFINPFEKKGDNKDEGEKFDLKEKPPEGRQKVQRKAKMFIVNS